MKAILPLSLAAVMLAACGGGKGFPLPEVADNAPLWELVPPDLRAGNDWLRRIPTDGRELASATPARLDRQSDQ